MSKIQPNNSHLLLLFFYKFGGEPLAPYIRLCIDILFIEFTSINFEHSKFKNGALKKANVSHSLPLSNGCPDEYDIETKIQTLTVKEL